MSSTASLPMERELTIVRTFDAPRALVFRAWTDPKMMVQWWAPRHFTNPVCELDVRIGGALRIVMRGPDGSEHPMKGVFTEVVTNERIVFTNIAVDAAGNHLLEGKTVVTLEDVGGKTKMTLVTRAVGKVPQAAFMLGGMEQGWTESIDKLEALLAQTR
jgi:uncharacterized protein YndB with AHSA1/START domain